MGCFCHASLTALEQQAPKLNLVASADGQFTDPLAAADPQTSAPRVGDPQAGELKIAEQARISALVSSLSAWLSARGLPAAPWHPDPAWLALQLPTPKMDMQAVATISALVQLRTQVLAQFGLDLLVPAQARAVARIVATMNVRLSAPSLKAIDPSGWVKLAAINDTIDHVEAARSAGLFKPPPHLLVALRGAGGVEATRWTAVLAPLQRLAPLIAATRQLDISVSETGRLADALRVLSRVSLPPLAEPDLIHRLTSGLSAVARLSTSLGVDPMRVGLSAVQERVQVKRRALLTALSSVLGQDLLRGAAGDRVTENLPNLPVVPSGIATADTVRLAAEAAPLASVNWKVPTSLPAVQIGLSTCTLAAQMQSALGIQAVRMAPCGSQCDAAALMRTAGAV